MAALSRILLRSGPLTVGIAPECGGALTRFDLRRGANGRSDYGACVSQLDGRAHGFRGNENIGKDDDGVDAQSAKGLERDFDSEIRGLANL